MVPAVLRGINQKKKRRYIIYKMEKVKRYQCFEKMNEIMAIKVFP